MKIQENKINNRNVIQIYLSKQEENDENIKSKIKEVQSKNTNVVIFVSGDKETNKTLKEMVNIMKNATITNY